MTAISRVAIVHVPAVALQALHERNPASHAIWLVSGVAMSVLAVIVLVEAVDWLRERRRRRGPDGDPVCESTPGRRVVREPDTALRRRFFRRLRPRRRPWSDREG